MTKNLFSSMNLARLLGVAFMLECHFRIVSSFQSMLPLSPLPFAPLLQSQCKSRYQCKGKSIISEDMYQARGSSVVGLQGSFARSDADFIELPDAVGGVGRRYEMIPLPDSMMDTTIFVGNLDEFVYDKDLSDLFQTVSILQSLPACVARKPNMSSLRYGFVTFPTESEKESAILRFHGYEWNGKRIKVEPIQDHPKVGRVRVPEHLVSYVSGAIKKTRNGRTNNLRRCEKVDNKIGTNAKRDNRGGASYKRGRKLKNGNGILDGNANAIASDLSSGMRKRRRLNGKELDEFNRAIKKGYLTLNGTGYYHGRNSNKCGTVLARVHREWCDAYETPQIILCKATSGRQLDNVIIDLSPLRLLQTLKFDKNDDLMLKWKIDIFNAAVAAGMELKDDGTNGENDLFLQESSNGAAENTADVRDTICDERDLAAVADTSTGATASNAVADTTRPSSITCVIILGETDNDGVIESDTNEKNNILCWDAQTLALQPIRDLPAHSIGIFEGERSKAKQMAMALSSHWGPPEEQQEDEYGLASDAVDNNLGNTTADSNEGGKHSNKNKRGDKRQNKMKGLRQHRQKSKVNQDFHLEFTF